MILGKKHGLDGRIEGQTESENLELLTSRPHAILMDFGLAEVFSRTQRNTNFSGTPVGIAPEVWMQDFDEFCDMWSAGVMLFQL